MDRICRHYPCFLPFSNLGPDIRRHKGCLNHLFRSGHDVLEDVISTGYLDLLKKLPIPDREEAMNVAAAYGQFELLHYLYTPGMKFVGWALDRAATVGNLKMVKFLYEGGAPVTEYSTDLATTGGHLETVKFLHERGSIHRIGLTTCIERGDLDMVKYLVEKGEEVMSWDVHTAAIHKHFDMVKYLWEKGGTISPGTMNLVIQSGPFKLIQKMRSAKMSCNPLGIKYACQRGSLKIMTLLGFDAEGDVRHYDMDGAARNGHLPMVKYIHERGGTCTTAAMDGAAANGHLQVVRYLYRMGKKYTYVAINEAVVNGHLEMVKYLVSIGATPTANALDSAVEHGYFDLVQFLFSCHTPCSNTIMESAVRSKSVEMVRYLHEQGQACTTQAMLNAAQQGQLLILQYFFSVHVFDLKDCVHAMDWAVPHWDVVKFLYRGMEKYLSPAANVVKPAGR